MKEKLHEQTQRCENYNSAYQEAINVVGSYDNVYFKSDDNHSVS